MTIDTNDPRWTAYVLDELGPSERADFEKEMETHPNSDALLAEIREGVELLEMTKEVIRASGLSPLARESIKAAAAAAATSSMAPVIPHPASYSRQALWGAAAAVLLLGILTSTSLISFLSAPATVLQNSVGEVFEVQETAGAIETGAAETGPVATGPVIIARNEIPAEAIPGLLPSTASIVESGNRTAFGENGDAFADELGKVADPVDTVSPGATPTPVEDQAGAGRTARADRDGRFEREGADPGDVTLQASGPPVQSSTEIVQLREQFAEVDRRLEATQFAQGNAVAAVVGGAFGEESFVSPDRPVRLAPGGRYRSDFNTEEYSRIVDNPFFTVAEDPLATFAVDVDTASYANVRRFLNQRMLPPPDAVRIEEMINYFPYDYPTPRDGRPFRVNAEIGAAPWNPEHRLVRLGIRGEDIRLEERSGANLVFLIDVSGSMSDPDKLPLLVDGMKLLVGQLGDDDRVAIVVYAGASGLVLPSTSAGRRGAILGALERLSAGGSTNGGAGIELAYDVAAANFVDGGINRVILATDGDFNIGVTNNGELTRLIEEKAGTGIFLSVLGFGTGNYNDAGLEALADRGNGNYAYIDTIREARKVLVSEVVSTLVTIAKDVKFQVEFNPAEVNAYRLIGYENRVLADQDFNDDTKDAGEIGAGHTVTALFEVVPVDVALDTPGVDPLRYQTSTRPSGDARSEEMLTVKIRYKEPDSDVSELISVPLTDSGETFESASTDFQFATAVAAFGMILRDSPYRESATFDSVIEIAVSSRGRDAEGYRGEFVELVRRARALQDLGGRR